MGGFANWVQDAEYTACPIAGKPHEICGPHLEGLIYWTLGGTPYLGVWPYSRIVSSHPHNTN